MDIVRRIFFCTRGQHRPKRSRVRHNGQGLTGVCRDCGCSVRKSHATGKWEEAKD